MPLAIVLAAAWADTLSLPEIGQELAHSFDFLETTLGDVPERHRNIRAAFDPSWQRLSDEEHMVFMQLAVFQGPFTREAAQAVTGASLRVLAALVNKSLLRHDPAGRYDVHELLRQYATEKLEADPAAHAAALERHARYYAAFMDVQGARLRSPEQRAALDAIVANLGNILSAFRVMVEHGWTDAIRQTSGGLWWGLDLYYRFHEALELATYGVEALGKLPATPEITATRAILMAQQSWFLNAVGNPSRGKLVAEQSLAILRPLADPEDLMVALQSLVMNTAFLNQPDELRQAAEEGLRVARASDHPGWSGTFLYWLGYVAVTQGDYPAAQRLGEGALAQAEILGDFTAKATALAAVLSPAARALGDYAEAKRLAEEALQLLQELGYFWGVATAYGTLGDLAFEMEAFEEARRNYRQQLRMFAGAGGGRTP